MNPQGRTPTVKLLSTPTDFHGMLYYLWQSSRVKDASELKSPSQYEYEFASYSAMRRGDLPIPPGSIAAGGKPVCDTLEKMIGEDIPVIEHASFVFMMEDVPVVWREQAVRQRIGTKFGDDYLWQVLPGAESSSYWSQTARIVPDDTFVDEGRFAIPQSVMDAPDVQGPTGITMSVKEAYLGALVNAQTSIKWLMDHGIPAEDARFLSPAGKTHNISWAVNLKALKYVLQRRACFITQLGVWGPVLSQMAKLLMDFSPLFRDLVRPPCFQGSTFKGCPIKHTNENMITGEDKQPPCPIYLHHHSNEAATIAWVTKKPVWYPMTLANQAEVSRKQGPEVTRDWCEGMPSVTLATGETVTWVTADVQKRDKMRSLRAGFQEAWSLNVDTGEPLKAEIKKEE